ncbi:MAG: Glutamyl-tRNA(Gln) amidotransferase subunit A [Candidatus Moanabacter tarae]|uniref:Glutamyl-tRNA(Gln) amidotransferase subunit A n=1 Tax=Candidatus Moanibacter tarae TaxID=2200854 RepID=A0A2Z4AFN1_9BACT|nr:MAG: Glutamyl-tRNA(Gln) amidotransferase subunit A [Candidatus Moanabacter tarae]|tara:strand:- start:22278 stop:23579 length:1302 start_codon:yes stop_codon:yes gene_type:complete
MCNLSIKDELDSLRSGDLFLGSYLDAICDRIDEEEGTIHAFVSGQCDRETIRSRGESLLKKYPETDKRPSLFGLPIGIKDIYRVDGYETRCGSRLPPLLFEGKQASSVTRLLNAGAVLMGKTVTTEFASYMPGPTRNPHRLNHTPGGSSSGSAAGVASGFYPVALGSQTVGSVIRPASFCGVFGFKPSFGRIPTDGVIPLAPSLDHVGFFCRDVFGLSPVASVLMKDWNAELSSSFHGHSSLVIGIPEGPYLERVSDCGRQRFAENLRRLREGGFQILEISAFPDLDEMIDCNMKIMMKEMAVVHKLWYEAYGVSYGPKTADLINKGMLISDERHKELLGKKKENCQRLEDLMDQNGVDFWIAPSATGPAPEGLESTGDATMNLPWTHCGMPVISVPIEVGGEGLPQGIQLVGRIGCDESLVEFVKSVSEILA